MRKNLFWSLFAATAILTACNDDNVVSMDNITPEGEKVGVNFTVNIGKPMGTYATESENGAWTNFQNDETMRSQYDCRAVLQVYQKDATAYMDEQRVLVADEEVGNNIGFENLRLVPGATYTAVVWVDFVANGEGDKDLYYNTQDLSNISMIYEDENVAQNLDPEGRDAYTAAVTFTLNADGKYTVEGEKKNPAEITAAIPLIAKRPFGKVRIVMTDKADKAEWNNYFAGASNSRVLNYVALGITGLNTDYNALKQEVKDNMIANFQFHHGYKSNITDGGEFWSQNNIKWVDKDGKSATKDNAKYPVLDYNYFLPAAGNKAASYDLGIKMFKMPEEITPEVLEAALATEGTTAENAIGEGGETLPWACISLRNLSGIPVKANCLTTIKGNFLTYGYNFEVTVSDLFDGNEVTITVDDKGKKTEQVETKEFGKTKVTITKDPEDGAVQTIAVVGMDAKSQEEIRKLIVGTNNHNQVDLTLSKVATDITKLAWSDFALKSVSVSMEAALAANCSMAFSAGTVTINSKEGVEQTKDITVTNVKDGGAINIESGVYNNLTANNDKTGSSLTVKNGAIITELSSNCITITLNGTTIPHNPMQASLTLTGTAETQTLVITGNPTCIPETITVDNPKQYLDIQQDDNNVWGIESGNTNKWEKVVD